MNGLPSPTGLRDATLIGVSLQHYRAEIWLRMIRYKQLIIAAVLLLLPSVVVFKALVFGPLVGIFATPGTPDAAIAAAVFVAVTALWAGLQRDAVAYPPAAAFTASLPLSAGALLRRDLVVFLLASSPFLLLILLALAAAQPSAGPGSAVLAFLGILLASLVAQLAVARGAFGWAVAAVMTAAAIGAVHRADVLVALAALNALMLWRLPRHVPWRTGDYRRSRGEATGWSVPTAGWIGLHWRSLYQAAHGAYRLSLFASAALTILAAAALHAGPDAPLRNCGILLVHAALVTGLLGMSFATLFKNQAAYGAVLQALPVSRWRRVFDEIVAAELPALLMVLLLASSSLRLASGPQIAAVALAATLLLCGLQYLIYRYCPRHTVAAGLLVGIATILVALQLASTMGIRQ